ncbi:MAG: FxsA family protein [Gammaproteobacteria bacterium]
MHPFQLLFLLFLIVPMAEIYLLIKVGGVIGAFPTMFLVVFTAVLGAWLLRVQGFSTLARIRSTMNQGGIPAMEMVEGAVLLVSGALLLTPGFFTDTIGFLCLIPALRRTMIRWALGRFLMPPGFGGPGSGSGKQSSGPTTLEGEYRREDD